MRFPRLVVFAVSAGLLGLPAVVATASSATAAALTSRLHVERTPSVQLYGHDVEVGAVLQAYQAGTWTAAAGQSLTLQRRIAGTTGFRSIATATTNSKGLAIFTTRAVANAAYRVRYAGSTQYSATTSSAVKVKVVRDLNARKDRINGPKFRFYGKVSPRYARRPIVLQRKLDGGVWRTVGRQRTTRYSRWSFVVFAKRTKGVVRYRAFTPKSTRFVASPSGVFKITTY